MYAGEVFCCYLKRTEGKNNRQKTKDGTEKKDFHRYHHYTNFLLKREALFRKNWKLEKDLQANATKKGKCPQQPDTLWAHGA